MAINSDAGVEGANGTRRIAGRGRRVAEGVGKATRRGRWMQRAGVLCWWLVLVGAAPVVGMEGPDGRAAGAKMRGRFTVLPQMLRIAEEDPAGGHYRASSSRTSPCS